MNKTWRSIIGGALIGLLAGPQYVVATTSGHYTDLLPNPTSASGVTSGTLYYNGYDWQMTTLAPTQIPGDALSRVPTTVYQQYGSTTVATSAIETEVAAIKSGLLIGTTTIPATWIAAGRSIRVTQRGTYTSTVAGSTWRWRIKMGTTTILDTTAVADNAGQTNQTFTATGLITISTIGASGTMIGQYDIQVSSGSLGLPLLNYTTNTVTAIPVDLTSQLRVNPTFLWGTSAAGNSITFTNVIVELLN